MPCTAEGPVIKKCISRAAGWLPGASELVYWHGCSCHHLPRVVGPQQQSAMPACASAVRLAGRQPAVWAGCLPCWLPACLSACRAARLAGWQAKLFIPPHLRAGVQMLHVVPVLAQPVLSALPLPRKPCCCWLRNSCAATQVSAAALWLWLRVRMSVPLHSGRQGRAGQGRAGQGSDCGPGQTGQAEGLAV